MTLQLSRFAKKIPSVPLIAILMFFISACEMQTSSVGTGQLINLDKERSIDVIITRLRKKIEIDPKNPKFLQTIRGAGYVLWIE